MISCPNNIVTIPPAGIPDGPTYLQSIINNLGGFNFAVGDGTNIPVNYDLVAEMVTTNDMGDYYTVLSNLNNSLDGDVPPHYYRYESGTSMAAAGVSGVLALMQDYFTNTLHLTPSPALLKAMLINGARPTGYYNLQVDNSINPEGWGLVNLPNSIPAGITNTAATATNSFFYVDQSPTNELATGDSRTYTISLSAGAMSVPLRFTLAWTDPPGNPAAAIKLVNNLDLIVTNMDNTNVYYGNDIGPNQVFNTPESSTNAAPSLDGINNVENVFLPANAGTNFTVVIRATAVNVNAVSEQTNNAAGVFAPNIVQDFAFVISSGNGSNTNGFAITGSSLVSNPTGDQRITIDSATNATPLMNQFVGASSPLLGTNTVSFGANTNELVTVGQTNQWHFYVVTNYGASSDFTNAAFVTFLPPTAAIPRGGVFANSDANSTRPEADIDLFVTTDPGLTNLDPNVISNCIINPQVGKSSPVGVNGTFYGAALDRGGSEFVVDTNSTPGQVYYVGVQSEDQMASEYAFLSEFSNIPFSSLDNNGNESAVFYPVNIPDGDATHPGYTNSLALTIFPVEIERVVVTNTLTQQNAGDLVISVNHSTVANGDGSVVLLNHDSPNAAGTYTTIYDDSGQNDILNSQPSDGPGSLGAFTGQEGMGVWLLHVSDNAPSFVGSVQGSLFIQPHIPLGSGTTNTVAPGKWYYNFVDVPPGATNLTISVTNLTSPPLPLDVYVKLGAQPTTNDFDKMMVTPTVPLPNPGGSLSIGPTDVPPIQPGRYYVGVYNPNPVGSADQRFSLFAAILPPSPSATPVDFAAAGPVPLLDDAITISSNSIITMTNTEPIVSVNVGIVVDHPRISDLAFTLISPDGRRILLMENRGGTTTNGAGASALVTNSIIVSSNDFEGLTATNYIAGQTVGGWSVASGQVSVVTNPANAYEGSNFLALASGSISTNLPTVAGQTYTLTFAYRGPGIAGWWRGENNVNDAIYGNNGTVQNAGFTNGVVGRAFSNDPENYPYGTYNGFDVPDQPAYQLTNSLSIEGWVRPRGDGYAIFWRGDSTPGYDPYFLGMQGNNTAGFYITDAANNSTNVNGTLTYNVWHHVAATLDGTSGNMSLYVDGVLTSQINTPLRPFGALNPGMSPGIGIANVNDGQNNFPFTGDIDEISLYSRAISASEVKAIFNARAGKFDQAEFANSPSLSLAEAQVSVNGSDSPAFFGSNTVWQTYTNTFTATSTGTPLVISGIEPGMLLDAINLTTVQTNTQYQYLTFTEDTNLTTTPIKFAVPPFVPDTNTAVLFTNSFEGTAAADYASGQTAAGWTVETNQVSVVADANTTPYGSNFLALANGTILTNLPTVAGRTYTLSFAYRGPGIVGWWRGETNTLDSIGGNNGSFLGSASYTNGEVGNAMSFNGVNNGVLVPASANLNVGADNGLTIEAWVNPSEITPGGKANPVVEWNEGDGYNFGSAFWLTHPTDPSGNFFANLVDTGGTWHTIFSPSGLIQTNVYQHVAVTYNKITGNAALFYNGVQVTNMNLESFTPQTSYPLYIGERPPGDINSWVFSGSIDEPSIYNRALSASEIAAIYSNGIAGKFNPVEFSTSPAQSLAEAQVSVNGQTSATLYGNNTSWQTETITFTATQNGTPLQISGIEPGMLLDDFVLTQEPGNLYYLPEQSLAPLDGESAAGEWQLEIQDDRAGAYASNNPPALVSWELQFVFADTNAVPSVLSGGIGQSNQFIPAGDIAWYQISVPANANYATNILRFASAPVNVWFSTNSPPTITNTGDVDLISDSTGNSVLLGTNGSPVNTTWAYIVPGLTYYLGVQNAGSSTVNYGIEVDFDRGNSTNSTLPQIVVSKVAQTGGGTIQFQWTASSSSPVEVQWTTNLASQVWNTITNPATTTSNGVSTFTDDGSQTAPLGAVRFYRLVQPSP